MLLLLRYQIRQDLVINLIEGHGSEQTSCNVRIRFILKQKIQNSNTSGVLVRFC